MIANTETHAPIPTEEQEQSAGQMKVWRIANGKLRYGPGYEGTEVLDSIGGIPIRIGCSPEGVTKEGAEIPEKLRVQLRRRDGAVETISVRKGSGQARGLISALVLWDGKSYVTIAPQLGDRPNKHGKIPTFVNLKEFTGDGWTSLRPDYDPDMSVDDYCKIIENEKPGIYKDFVPNADAGAPWDDLADWLEKNGWQSFAGQGAYLAIIGKALKLTIATTADIPESFWGGAIGTFEHAAKRNLIPDAMKADGSDEPADDDPFA